MNIVLIVMDTFRYDAIGAYGDSSCKTPNFDKLTSKSLNFHRAFAASFPTIPHRTDIITGRYGGPFHMWKPLDCDVPTIPKALAELGYCTQLINDTPHLDNGGHGFDYPFHAWTHVSGASCDRAWITDSWDLLPNWKLDPMFDDIADKLGIELRKISNLNGYVPTNRHREREEDWNATKLFSRASAFLRDNTTRDNFFLWVDCFDPHEPWDAPPRFMKLHDKSDGYEGTIDPRTFHNPLTDHPDLPEEGITRIKAQYRAKVTLVDAGLGTFLETLDETGLAGKTAVLVTADHGTNLGDRLGGRRFHKQGPPRANEAWVPCIVHIPGIEPGDSNLIAQPQDLFASILDIAGADAATVADIDSQNVVEAASSGGPGKREIALCGSHIAGWSGDADKVLFSVFDDEWSLGFAANPERCQLQRLGTQEDVSSAFPDVVECLWKTGVAEIRRRGIDPDLASWLDSQGTAKFPTDYRTTDTHPRPPEWNQYWNWLYTRLDGSEPMVSDPL